MEAESVWRRRGYSLAPESAEARDALLMLREGGLCVGKITVAQRPEQLRKYWATCQDFANLLNVPKRKISDCNLIRMGHYERKYLGGGRMLLVPGSISTQNMDAVDFMWFMRCSRVFMQEHVAADAAAVQREFVEQHEKFLAQHNGETLDDVF